MNISWVKSNNIRYQFRSLIDHDDDTCWATVDSNDKTVKLWGKPFELEGIITYQYSGDIDAVCDDILAAFFKWQ